MIAPHVAAPVCGFARLHEHESAVHESGLAKQGSLYAHMSDAAAVVQPLWRSCKVLARSLGLLGEPGRLCRVLHRGDRSGRVVPRLRRRRRLGLRCGRHHLLSLLRLACC